MMNRNSHNPGVPALEPNPNPALDARIARALAQPPRVSIPASFAASVAARATAQPLSRPALFTGWGPRLALFSGALLTAAMFALAPHATPTLTSLPFDAELLLLAELSTLLLFANRILLRD